MVLTGRTALLALLGTGVVALAAPSAAGVVVVTTGVLALAVIDATLAGPVRSLRLSRTGDRAVDRKSVV